MAGRRLLFRAVLAPTLLVLASCGTILPSGHPQDQYHAVFAAASAGDVDTVAQAIAAKPSIVKAREWGGATLLHDAVGQNREQVVALLIDKHADVNAVTHDKITPLHMAAQNGNTAIIIQLLARKAEVNPVDAQGWTPLDRAHKWHHDDAADFLAAHGGKPGPATP